MFPTADDLIEQLYSELADCESPLPIKLCKGIISGFGNGFNETYDFSCTFRHPEVDIEIGYMCPTRFEAFDIDPAKFSKLNYKDQVSLVLRQAAERDFPIDASDPPWFPEGNQGDAKSAIRKWLRQKFGFEHGDESVFLWELTKVGEYLPGVAILARMPELEAQQLGMRLVNTGGPASSVPAVRVGCSAAELNKSLHRHGLPFMATEQP